MSKSLTIKMYKNTNTLARALIITSLSITSSFLFLSKPSCYNSASDLKYTSSTSWDLCSCIFYRLGPGKFFIRIFKYIIESKVPVMILEFSSA